MKNPEKISEETFKFINKLLEYFNLKFKLIMQKLNMQLYRKQSNFTWAVLLYSLPSM